MPAIDVVSDASVALKWFHEEGEADVEASRAILAAHQARDALVAVLDLTAYEVGNALLRGPAGATPEQVAMVVDALETICPVISPEPSERRLAAELAAEHSLTYYDASYAAVALKRDATLVTADADLLRAGLGSGPGDVAATLSRP